jgi:hypothetical protein
MIDFILSRSLGKSLHHCQNLLDGSMMKLLNGESPIFPRLRVERDHISTWMSLNEMSDIVIISSSSGEVMMMMIRPLTQLVPLTQ